MVETVKSLVAALQSGDMELASSLLADNFEFIGISTPKVLNKAQFLGLTSELLAAMPDFSYNLSDVHRGEGRTVTAFIQISGTHTNTLSLPIVGLNAIPATGLVVSLPQTPITFQLEQGKIQRMQSEVVAGGGLAGLVQQIGSELPLMKRRQDVAD